MGSATRATILGFFLCLAISSPVWAKALLLDSTPRRLGDGGFGPKAHPAYSVSFHLASPARVRVVIKDLRPIDSPVSVVRLLGGVLTGGIGLVELGSFGAELELARLEGQRPGRVLMREPVPLLDGATYRSSWTPRLPPGDYVLTVRPRYHEALAEWDDFVIGSLVLESEGRLSRLGVGVLHGGDYRLQASGGRAVGFSRRQAEQAAVLELVDARTRLLALELEVMRLKEALRRAGVSPVGIKDEPDSSPGEVLAGAWPTRVVE